MSSYIIAGSADSIDTAYCQEIARRIKAKYKNIDFRIVIKHPSQWEQYLQQICRIYGFLKKANPIIYTFDGKIIGNKEAFMSSTAKYFGLDQEALFVENLSNKVNMKIATEEVNRKNRIKNNIKTLKEKVQQKYKELLKKNILKHELKDKDQYLTNGIEYIHRKVKGIVPQMVFIKNKQVPATIDPIVASDIDLMAISQNDQIKVQEQSPNNTTGKQAFVTTNNEKNPSQHDKMSMSQASRTNKLHESMVSNDKQSKQMKQSSKSKLKIDEQMDQIPDYIDHSIPQEIIVTALADNFYVAYNRDRKCYINGQMQFYHDEDNNGHTLRIHNDNRPVKGHRVQIREIHFDFDGQNIPVDSERNIREEPQTIEAKPQQQQAKQGSNQVNNEATEKKQGYQKAQQKVVQVQGEFKQQKKQTEKNQQKATEKKEEQLNTKQNQKGKMAVQKIRTQPNIPIEKIKSSSNKNIGPQNQDEMFSQIQSDLNLVSHLNYHTLYIKKPLSPMEIKNLLYFIEQTNTIGCLQFLPQNPNPKVKLYHRKFLLQTDKQDMFSLMLPIEQFIQKQFEDEQIKKLEVPNENCYDYQSLAHEKKYEVVQVNELGFQHYLIDLEKIRQTHKDNEFAQNVSKALKYVIDSMLTLEQQLKKDIGYNLIFTSKYILLVPLSAPYEIYNQNKLYLDGLAYLGFIHTAQLTKPYQMKAQEQSRIGNNLRQMLSKCANQKVE